MRERIREYIGQLREDARRGEPSPGRYDWGVARERCDVLNEVADALEEMLKESEKEQMQRMFMVQDWLEEMQEMHSQIKGPR